MSTLPTEPTVGRGLNRAVRLRSPDPAPTVPQTTLPRICAIGGGTGLPVVLRGLSEALSSNGGPGALLDPDRLTGIVTVTDDGGSSGRLREELGILPPGDARNCLFALAEDHAPLAALLQHRFVGDTPLAAHPVGNLLLAALTQITGDFAIAVDRLGQILSARGRVFPSTHESVTLRAELEDGETVAGETAIVRRRRRIRRLWLDRQARVCPDALRALVNADVVVVGPGSLYTSLLPNLLVGGLAPTLSGVNAVRIYVANLMTEPGETDGFTLEDHLRVIKEHVGFDLFDHVLVNNRPPDPAMLATYAAEGSVPVTTDGPCPSAGPAQIVRLPIAAEWRAGKIRHAPADLAQAILGLAREGRPAFTPLRQAPAASH